MATYEHERAKPTHPHCQRAAVSLRFTGALPLPIR